MALDGMFIRQLSFELKEKLINSRIDSIDGINKTDFSFRLRASHENLTLFMSVSYNNPTVFVTDEKFEKPSVPSNFTMLLRKHLEGGIIKDIKQLNSDRVLEIDILSKDEIEGYNYKRIVLELIGRFSNLLLLSNEFKVIDAVKQLSVMDEPNRVVLRGIEYIPLKNDKIKLENKEKINNLIDSDFSSDLIFKNISGVSKNLSEYLFNNYNGNNLYDYLIKEVDKLEPVKFKNDFYFFNIFNSKDVTKYESLSSLLYNYYLEYAKEKSLKDSNQDVFRTIDSNIKRLERKLNRLDEDLKKAENADIYRLKGELLQSIAYNNIKKAKVLKVLNYYNNEYIDIEIDESKSLVNNSQIYYKKYKKAKVAVNYIINETTLAKADYKYFKILKNQSLNASLNDLKEIRDELNQNGYLKNKTQRPNSKKNKPNYLEFKIMDCSVYVGKNNIQNNYLTWKKAKKDDLFFHVKDEHGSHVIVSGDNKYNEEVIRFAAKKAMEYSASKKSGSVPINYTLVKNLKKVPGTKGSFVTYKTNKTIYID